MHWSGHFAANAGAGHARRRRSTDPFSGQPELKHVPVRITREATAWAGVLITRRDLRPTGFVHWSRRAVDGGWVYELGGTETPDQGILLARKLLDVFRRDQLLEYTDRRGLTYRAAAVDEAGAMAEALLVAPPGQLPARDWLLSLLASRRAAVDRLDRHGAAVRPRRRCRCRRSGASSAPASMSASTSSPRRSRPAAPASRRSAQRCSAGTNCGSCRSEIRTIIDRSRLQAAE